MTLSRSHDVQPVSPVIHILHTIHATPSIPTDFHILPIDPRLTMVFPIKTLLFFFYLNKLQLIDKKRYNDFVYFSSFEL